jgi:NADH-quinone oxidoreductase subunit C
MTPVSDNKTLLALEEKFGESVIKSSVDRGDAVAVIASGALHEVIAWLRDEQDFKMLSDLCGVDYLPREPRFEVVYQLHAMGRGERLRLRVQLDGKTPEVASISDLYPVADWLERETWDMFGIVFSGHPNLKRILMYEPFEGHPLRRDYPINRRQPLIGPRN